MPRAQNPAGPPASDLAPWYTSWPLLGWVLGCAVQLQQGQLGPWWTYAGAGLLALGLAMAVRRGPPGARQRAGLGIFLSVALLAWGSTGMRAMLFQAQGLAPALEGRDVLVEGIVTSLPQTTDRGQRWLFTPTQAWDGADTTHAPAIQLPPLIALQHYQSRPTEASATKLPPSLTVRPGERWRWTVRLQRPHGSRNPHGFDAELWWWQQGVQATGYVRAQPAPQRLGLTSHAWLEQARDHVRQRLLAHAGPSRATGVVTALITGDQAAIAKADWQVFRTTGVAHLVSISGLHITMFAWLAVAVVGWIWRRSARLCLHWPAALTAAWAGLALALAYALFSGWGIPAQRTLLMLLTVTVLRSLGMAWPWPRTWLLVLAVVVAWDPWALLQAGFWLSFVAVGILFMTDPGPRAAQAPGRWWQPLWRLLREQVLIGLALAPLTVLLFGHISIVGFVANLWAIPWVTIVLTPLAMLGVLWPPIWTAATACAQALLTGLGWMAQWPGAVATFAQPPLGLGLLGMLGCAWLLVRWPGGMRWLGLSLVLPLLLWQPPRPKPGEFSLLALDIGQGSSLLLQTAQHALLVDAGPRWASGDAGSQSIVPLLQALGVRLNRVLLTHADSDHTGGALSVLAAQPQADLLGSGIAALADQAQRPWQPCARGQQWAWDGVHFSVLWPAPATVKAANHKNTNAQSCVLLVRSAHGATALLAGDLERAQEHALLALHAGQSSDLQAHALVVAHHGSQTSTSAPWLAAVQPQVALIQSGWRNRFGHPAAAVVQRLTAAQARIFNTAQCGAIDWQSSRPDQAQCQRQRQPRYWQTLPHPTPTALATNTTGPE